MKNSNIFKRLLLIVLALMCSIVLASCNKTPGEPDGSDSESGSETTPIAEKIDIIKDGKTDFKIIRADQTETSLIQLVVNFRRNLTNKCDINIDFVTDWSADNKQNNTVTSSSDVHEILVGDTNREESKNALAQLNGKFGFIINFVNGKIALQASNETLLNLALDYFVNELVTEQGLSLEDGFTYVYNLASDDLPIGIIGNEYTVIYSSKADSKVSNAARKLANSISKYTGKTVNSYNDVRNRQDGAKEILIGDTNRPESLAFSEKLNYMDYGYYIEGDTIVIGGGSPFSTLNAIDKFLTDISTGIIQTLDTVEYIYDFDLLLEDSLIHRVDSFVPVWANQFTTPEWMLDINEKLYAITAPSGRMTSDSHRGDTDHYPENTLEAILSAIMMGADVVEIDIRLTKDNVMVLLHDDSLMRITDFNQKRGKNGLPSEASITEWTYEQLQQLNLLHNGVVTEYKIPTVYEAIALFKGRALVHFDCKVDEVDKNSDVYLLAEELDAKESFVYYYGLSTMQTWVSYDKNDTEFAATIDKLAEYLSRAGHGMRKRDYSLIAKYGDNASGWNKQYNDGKRMIFTNKIFGLAQYIAENQQAFEY